VLTVVYVSGVLGGGGYVAGDETVVDHHSFWGCFAREICWGGRSEAKSCC
jgi:hypothetical protein